MEFAPWDTGFLKWNIYILSPELSIVRYGYIEVQKDAV